jgi:hypothetical protein
MFLLLLNILKMEGENLICKEIDQLQYRCHNSWLHVRITALIYTLSIFHGLRLLPVRLFCQHNTMLKYHLLCTINLVLDKIPCYVAASHIL